MTNLCLVSSEGDFGMIKYAKSGSLFKSDADDVLRLSLNMDKMELTVEGKKGQKCVIAVDQLQDKQDRYYACVFLSSMDDCALIS
jgi:hypothetical protein